MIVGGGHFIYSGVVLYVSFRFFGAGSRLADFWTRAYWFFWF